MTLRAVFAFSELTAISAGVSSSAVVARDKGATHEGSAAAMNDGTQGRDCAILKETSAARLCRIEAATRGQKPR